MPAWISVFLWWIAFGGTHVGLSSISVRASLIQRLGERGFQGFYSLVSFVTFVPLVMVYFRNRHSGPLLWSFGLSPVAHAIAIVLSIAAFMLLVPAFIQPSAVSLAGGSSTRARGVTRITRHPLFMAIALWSLSHLLINGFLTDVAFFGGFVAFSLVGAAHQDVRKQQTTGATLREFYAETSLLPFGAIIAGRNRLVLSEIPWIGVAIGAVVAVAVYLAHGPMFGA